MGTMSKGMFIPNRWHGKADVYPLTFKGKFDGQVACGIVADEGDDKTEGDITYIPIFPLDWYL